MLIRIADVLSEDTLGVLTDQLKALKWEDGARTAGSLARAVKKNEQAKLKAGVGRQLQQTLLTAIRKNAVVQAAAQPARFSDPMISRTSVGGGYGPHIDNALMGTGAARMRSDLSYTLALNAPRDYKGGALEIESAGMVQALHLEPGELVVYPSTSIHQITPVSAGERIVCVGWIQSKLQDPAVREILFDLENLRASLKATHDPQSPELLTVTKAISNLLRRFGSP
ncbi:MAG: Fe2+-dependent dioxygenase [Pseudomonadota bacterium]